MGIEISPNIENRLTAKARELGLSMDALLERLMSDSESNNPALCVAEGSGPELPAWHLSANSSYHRRDIYDDDSG